jgi:hypothetical protein
MRKLTVLIAALTLSLAAMPAATARGADVVRGELEGGSMPIFDPEAVAARCQEGFEWILQTFGSGELTTDVYTGEFTYSGEHCSRWLAGPPDSPHRAFPGRLTNGVLTLATPEGDLVLTYAGVFVFRRDPTVAEFASKVRLRYRVDGGDSTGVFAGASGRGLLIGEDQMGYEVVRFFGRLATQG